MTHCNGILSGVPALYLKLKHIAMQQGMHEQHLDNIANSCIEKSKALRKQCRRTVKMKTSESGQHTCPHSYVNRIEIQSGVS